MSIELIMILAWIVTTLTLSKTVDHIGGAMGLFLTVAAVSDMVHPTGVMFENTGYILILCSLVSVAYWLIKLFNYINKPLYKRENQWNH